MLKETSEVREGEKEGGEGEIGRTEGERDLLKWIN